MGYTTQQQQPLGTNVTVKLLDLIREEAEEQDRSIAGEFFKVGAAILMAVWASLRGLDVFMMGFLIFVSRVPIYPLINCDLSVHADP